MADSIETLLRKAAMVGAATAGGTASGFSNAFADGSLAGGLGPRKKKPAPFQESLSNFPMNAVNFSTKDLSDSYQDYLMKTPEGRSVLLNGMGLMDRSGTSIAGRKALAAGLAVAGATPGGGPVGMAGGALAKNPSLLLPKQSKLPVSLEEIIRAAKQAPQAASTDRDLDAKVEGYIQKWFVDPKMWSHQPMAAFMRVLDSGSTPEQRVKLLNTALSGYKGVGREAMLRYAARLKPAEKNAIRAEFSRRVGTGQIQQDTGYRPEYGRALKGGATVTANELTFGGLDKLGLTDSSQYEDLEGIGASHALGALARELLITAASGGTVSPAARGALATVGRAAVTGSRLYTGGRTALGIKTGVEKIAKGEDTPLDDVLLVLDVMFAKSMAKSFATQGKDMFNAAKPFIPAPKPRQPEAPVRGPGYPSGMGKLDVPAEMSYANSAKPNVARDMANKKLYNELKEIIKEPKFIERARKLGFENHLDELAARLKTMYKAKNLYWSDSRVSWADADHFIISPKLGTMPLRGKMYHELGHILHEIAEPGVSARPTNEPLNWLLFYGAERNAERMRLGAGRFNPVPRWLAGLQASGQTGGAVAGMPGAFGGGGLYIAGTALPPAYLLGQGLRKLVFDPPWAKENE